MFKKFLLSLFVVMFLVSSGFSQEYDTEGNCIGSCNTVLGEMEGFYLFTAIGKYCVNSNGTWIGDLAWDNNKLPYPTSVVYLEKAFDVSRSSSGVIMADGRPPFGEPYTIHYLKKGVPFGHVSSGNSGVFPTCFFGGNCYDEGISDIGTIVIGPNPNSSVGWINLPDVGASGIVVMRKLTTGYVTTIHPSTKGDMTVEMWEMGDNKVYCDMYFSLTSTADVQSWYDYVDTDGDGVMDSSDDCPNTPEGSEVDGKGCTLPDFPACYTFTGTVIDLGNYPNIPEAIGITIGSNITYKFTVDTNSDGFVVTEDGQTLSMSDNEQRQPGTDYFYVSCDEGIDMNVGMIKRSHYGRVNTQTNASVIRGTRNGNYVQLRLDTNVLDMPIGAVVTAQSPYNGHEFCLTDDEIDVSTNHIVSDLTLQSVTSGDCRQ